MTNVNGKLIVINSQGHKVVITAEPLKIEFVDSAGEVAVVLNENSQLLIEPLRVRRERVDDEDGNGENALDVVSVMLPNLFYVFLSVYLSVPRPF